MKKFTGVLRQITSDHDIVRTKEMQGFFYELPQLHYSFCIYGEPLDPEKDFRGITTSPIQALKMTKKGRIKFTTLNSVYELEVLSEVFTKRAA